MLRNQMGIKVFLSIIVTCFALNISTLKVFAISANDSSTTQPVYGIVNTGDDNLNIRSGPGTAYGILGQLSSGTYIMIVGVSGDFYKVQYTEYGQSYGWVAKQYVIDKSSICPGKVKCNTETSSIYVRDAANSSGNTIGYMPHASYAPAVSSQIINNGWYNVIWGRRYGFVTSQYGWYTSY